MSRISFLTLAFAWTAAGIAQETPSGQPKPESGAEARPAPSKKGASKDARDDPEISIRIELDGRTDDFDTPTKALALVRRAVAAEKRSKDDFEFTAEIAFGKNRRSFRKPAPVQEALLALQDAVRDLKRVRANLDDVGAIPDAEPESDSALDQKRLADGQAELRRRINDAMMRQFRGGRPPQPQQMQRIVDQEVQRARQEGLIPAGAATPNNPGFDGGPDAQRTAVLDAVKSSLQQTFGKGAPEGDVTKPES